MLPDEKKKMQESVDQMLGGAHNMNKTQVVSGDIDVKQLGLSPSDLKILESEISKLRRFCNLIGVDSSLYNDPANKTFNNRKEAQKSAYTNVYIPNDKRMVDGLNKWLAPQYVETPGTILLIVQDFSEVDALQEDKDKSSVRQERVSREVTKILQSVGKPVENGGITSGAAFVMLTEIYNFEEDKVKQMLK